MMGFLKKWAGVLLFDSDGVDELNDLLLKQYFGACLILNITSNHSRPRLRDTQRGDLLSLYEAGFLEGSRPRFQIAIAARVAGLNFKSRLLIGVNMM